MYPLKGSPKKGKYVINKRFVNDLLNWAIFSRQIWATCFFILKLIHCLHFHFASEAVAVSFNIYHHTMVQQSVQYGRNDGRIMEQLGPVWKSFVGGDNRTGFSYRWTIKRKHRLHSSRRPFQARPAWQAFNASDIARCVLPTPGGPKNTTLPFCRINARSNNDITFYRSRLGWNVKSNSSILTFVWCYRCLLIWNESWRCSLRLLGDGL